MIDLRNRALLAVAYDAMLRRSELAVLQADDLLEDMHGDATLLVRRRGDAGGRRVRGFPSPYGREKAAAPPAPASVPARHSRRCPIRLQIQCGQDQHPVDDEANAIEFGQEFGQEREHRRAGTLSRRR